VFQTTTGIGYTALDPSIRGLIGIGMVAFGKGFDSPPFPLDREVVKHPVDWSIGPLWRTPNTKDILLQIRIKLKYLET
jgi:hypothetical protein